MVSGLLSQHIAKPTGTLNFTNGIRAKTAAICIGIGIKAIKIPSKTALEIIFLFVARYSGGTFDFFISSCSFLFLVIFLRFLRNMYLLLYFLGDYINIMLKLFKKTSLRVSIRVNMGQRILLLEDDRILAQSIEELLVSDSFLVDVAFDGEEASELTYDNVYDLYLLDINVPKLNGFDLLQSLRDTSDDTPTIFISAMVDIKTMTQGFNLGAMDYIKKPFDPEELLLRINSKIKKNTNNIVYHDLVYDPNRKELRKDSHIINLSAMLLDIFHLLITSQDKIVDKNILEDCMQHPSSQALRVAINKLKKVTGLPIKNIRGIGYIVESN